MNHIGKIICARRIEKNWNQEELSRGICAVSYLSKIEKGKAEPSEEIVKQLLERLGITLDTQKEKEAQQLAEKAYELVFSAMNQEFIELMEDADPDDYAATQYGLDLRILKQLAANDSSSLPKESGSFAEQRTKAMIQILSGSAEEAVSLYPNAWMYLMAGIETFEKENIQSALSYLNTAYAKAAEEGTVRVMLSANLYQYRCAALTYDYRRMEETSRTARKIALSLGERSTLFMIEYNMALAALACGKNEEAYEFFSSLEKPNKLSLLMEALAAEKTGRSEEAKLAVKKAEKSASGARSADLCLKLVQYRLKHPEYLSENEYGQLLRECYDCLIEEPVGGLEILIVQRLLEWYLASRQYKKAYELLEEYPSAALKK